MDNEKPRRKNSLRLKGYDYSQQGIYFITLCTQDRDSLFGKVENGEMKLSEFGNIVAEEWLKTSDIRKEIFAGVFMVMPDHFHAILQINDHIVGVEGVPPQKVIAKSLSRLVAGLKRITTKRINEVNNSHGKKIWQRGFFDRVLRNEKEVFLTEKYIYENPMRWELNKEDKSE